MKAKLIFIEKKQNNLFFWKTQNPNTKSKKLSFFISTNIQFTIMEQFLQFKACKSGEIDTIGIEVAQQIKLSGCPTKGYFTTKNAILAVLAVNSNFLSNKENNILC